jgi:branched-chain amino acid transport system substrate-binding protein
VSDHRLSRETFVKRTALSAAGVAFGVPAFLPNRGEAANELRIGVIEPRTGVFAGYGHGETMGIALAIDHWNAHGGVMSRKVVTFSEDDDNDPGVGVEKARKLVQQDQCVALIGTSNSAIALSVSATAKTLGVPFICSGSHADDVTDRKCSYNTFRVCHSTWMETHATGLDLAERFGKKWYLIAPDYAYGHAMLAGYQDVAKKIGGTIVGSDLVPLTTTDFSSYISNVETVKPDLFVVLVQGDQFTYCIKQAGALGLTKKLPLGGPQADYEAIAALPPEDRIGYWGVEWYYNSPSCIGKPGNSGHWFVSNFRKRYGIPPTARSAFGYIAMDTILWAITEAQSTDTVKVARTLEEKRFQSIFDGLAYYRKVDHQLMWPMWIGEVRKNGTAHDPYDLFNIIGRQSASVIEKPASEKAETCHIEYP